MIAQSSLGSIVPIDLLKPNEKAHIVNIVGETGEVHRLSEMGLRTGTCIRVIRCGSPCLLALDGKRLSVRLSPSVDILVSTSVSHHAHAR